MPQRSRAPPGNETSLTRRSHDRQGLSFYAIPAIDPSAVALYRSGAVAVAVGFVALAVGIPWLTTCSHAAMAGPRGVDCFSVAAPRGLRAGSAGGRRRRPLVRLVRGAGPAPARWTALVRALRRVLLGLIELPRGPDGDGSDLGDEDPPCLPHPRVADPVRRGTGSGIGRSRLGSARRCPPRARGRRRVECPGRAVSSLDLGRPDCGLAARGRIFPGREIRVDASVPTAGCASSRRSSGSPTWSIARMP